MYYVYVLKSKKNGKLYYGSTMDLKRRFKQHNSGRSFSTKTNGPWDLVYYEAFKSGADARNREKKLKSYGSARGHLKSRIYYSLKQQSAG